MIKVEFERYAHGKLRKESESFEDIKKLLLKRLEEYCENKGKIILGEPYISEGPVEETIESKKEKVFGIYIVNYVLDQNLKEYKMKATENLKNHIYSVEVDEKFKDIVKRINEEWMNR